MYPFDSRNNKFYGLVDDIMTYTGCNLAVCWYLNRKYWVWKVKYKLVSKNKNKNKNQDKNACV